MNHEAVVYAEKAHEGAIRKGSKVPYITHPLETALIVSLITDDEELVTAALLHDVIEDAGKTVEEIEILFGKRVAGLVAAESEDKTKSWIQRKGTTIDFLSQAHTDHKILALGDKLSNIRSTARDAILLEEEIWNRFNEKRKEYHAWYYWGIAEALKELACYPQYQEYIKLCQMVFGDCDDYDKFREEIKE